ncbi:MAG: hypothetical protein ABI680_03395 [Chthoniobacteraceae bacterium]
MTTTLDFAVVELPLCLAVLALLVFGRRHIHEQMEQIAEMAKAGAATRSRRAVTSNAAKPCTCEAFVPRGNPHARQPA